METGNYFLTSANTGGSDVERELGDVAEVARNNWEATSSDLKAKLSNLEETVAMLQSKVDKNHKDVQEAFNKATEITNVNFKFIRDHIKVKANEKNIAVTTERFNKYLELRFPLLGNCCICFDPIYLLQDVVIICENKHVVCRTCNDQHKLNRCPLCREDLLERDLRRSPTTSQEVRWTFSRNVAKKFVGVAN
tara:strand:- start:38313 stop:38891 length:579 start_codon:yes stop_codon:yes gene_type:complete